MALVLGACTGSVKSGAPRSDAGNVGGDAESSTTEDGGSAAEGDAGRGADAGSGGEEDAGREDARVTPGEDASQGQDGDDAATQQPEPDAGRADTGTPAQPDTGVPDSGTVAPMPGTVPVYVAVGYGTRRIVSCDYGQTWKNDEFDVDNGGDDGYLARGLTTGEGKFVAAVGGGGVQMLMTSDDGVAWNRIMRDGNGYSDVAYGNGLFVAGGGHISLTSPDGVMWGDPGSMGGGGIVRHLAFGDYMGGRFVGVGDQGRRVNSRDGVAWDNNVEGGDTLRGVDYGNGVFVAITSGSATQYSEDGGDSWQSGSISGASNVRGILFDGERFIVTSRSNSYTSTNGKDWQSHSATGGPESFDVSDDGEHYAGSYGDVLYHSTDGVNFTVKKMGGQAFTRVKFERVKPSSICPE